MTSTTRRVVRLLDVRDAPLSVDEVLAAVADPRCRRHVRCSSAPSASRTAGARSTGLGYSAHPSVVDELRAVAEEVVAAHPVRALAAVHRVGDLAVGDLAVVVGVSCPHRGEAFVACRR